MNVIYIHTHDSGRVLSPYGYDVPTPNLKQFASDSLMFRQAYCASPTCSPSRAAMLTGRYPHQNGMIGLGNRGFGLNDYSQHLVQFLNGHNYETVLCGIQHEAGAYLDHQEAAETIGYRQDITNDPSGYSEPDLVKWDYHNAQTAAKWIENYDGEKSFFMSFGFFATHREYPQPSGAERNPDYIVPPFAVPDRPETRADYAGYLESAAWFDKGFGLIMEALKKSGHYEDSIIFFTTDHGIAMPFCKCSLFDTGTGVAFLMRVPESGANGTVSDTLISQVDVFPTLCHLLDLDRPDYLEGVSFAGLYDETAIDEREEVVTEINFHTSYEPCRAVRTNRYKYLRYYDDYLEINKSNIDEGATKDYYLNHGLETRVKYREALYDLVYDPYEKRNLIDERDMAAVAADMRDRLLAFQQRTKDPILQGPYEMQAGWKVNKRESLKPSSKNPADYI